MCEFSSDRDVRLKGWFNQNGINSAYCHRRLVTFFFLSTLDHLGVLTGVGEFKSVESVCAFWLSKITKPVFIWRGVIQQPRQPYVLLVDVWAYNSVITVLLQFLGHILALLLLATQITQQKLF